MANTETPIDIEYLRSWIGREQSVSESMTPDLVAKFNATFNRAAKRAEIGAFAPPLIHYCLGQPAIMTSQLGIDGHPQKGGFLPPVPLPRRMWAGSQLRLHHPLHVGDMVKRVSRIADVVVKQGRSGSLCFVTVTHRLEVQGRLMIEESQDIVYRSAAVAALLEKPLAPIEAPVTGDHHRVIVPDAALLFRYSALTFNGHRIHYDRTYARNIEHHPGLVVHGPLQATLLLQFACDLKGKMPVCFSFRSQTVLYDGDRINLHASEQDGKMQLWTCRDGGPVAMRAEAEWACT